MTTTYLQVRHHERVDGGYSGTLTVTVAEGKHPSSPALVFIDSDGFSSRLVLRASEATELAAALATAAEKAGEA